VNELERELDMCKSVVDIERSRMGELSIRHAHASANASAGQRRRNRSTRDVGELDAAALDTSFRETQRRYREAVGEEKG
jgi:predicted RNA-binding protein with RPS1 domain